MLFIHPNIVVHENKMYLDAKQVWKRLCLVHHKKAAGIKDEVGKLLRAGFISPVPLTDWVSNVVPVMKK